VVRNRENFWGIASSNRINVNTIIGANPWLPDLLARRGQEILVLNQRGCLHVVRRGESLASVSALYRVPAGLIRRSNGLFFLAGVRPGSVVFIPGVAPKLMTQTIHDYFQKRKLFISPASGKYKSGFGWREHPITHGRNFHKGLDIKAKYGSLVWAAADGVVIAAGAASGYGNVVIIQHKDGFTTLYAHNSVILVSTGRKVHRGQPIARAGNSGASTGTHVHFEVRKDGKPDDPATYLW
jgi:murein DD-endopeptidase MepM/ murein hydrolase activator NlpD